MHDWLRAHDLARSETSIQGGFTVRLLGNGDFASMYSDSLRAQGPRPAWVIEEARVLNEQAHLFVPIYEKFMRQCRDKLTP